MRLRITTAPALSTPCIWKTDFAISRPIVLTSPMAGSHQCGLLKATTLGHFDAAEWAPSTASKADICGATRDVRFGPKADQIGADRAFFVRIGCVKEERNTRKVRHRFPQ